MPIKSAIHLRLKEAGEFLHNNVKISFSTLVPQLGQNALSPTSNPQLLQLTI